MGKVGRKYKNFMVELEKSVFLKELGGLGIKDIRLFDEPLLAKQRWNLFNHEGELWGKVLESRYGVWRGLVEEGNIREFYLVEGFKKIYIKEG